MLFSIITVSFNSSRTIEQTITSVLSQRNVEFEYIIIDGASNDGTQEIIEKYKDRLAYYISEPDCGISDAFNKGISKAKGDIIGIINSDDILLEGALEYVKNSILDNTDVFCGRIKKFTSISEIPRIEIDKNTKIIHFDDLRKRMVISHPATFVRNTTYRKYGVFDVSYRYSMDRELMLRMYLKGAKFQQSNMILTLFRDDGITGTHFLRSIDESYKISIRYGTNRITANWVRIKKIIRFKFLK